MTITRREGETITVGLMLLTIVAACAAMYGAASVLCGLTIIYEQYNENRL